MTSPHAVVPAEAGVQDEAGQSSRLWIPASAGTAVEGLILLARLWQLGPSRLIPPTCRYSPSCSAYAIEAWRLHGVVRGSILATRRLLRCHPWGGCGHDPVPAPVPTRS